MRAMQSPGKTMNADALLDRLHAVRRQTEALAAPLSAEDAQVQSMPDASPTKWHLAHTTWFFETMVLERFEPGFRPFDANFRMLFNSYYQAVGERHPRPQRGLLTRPALGEVLAWRAAVDERLAALCRRGLPDEALGLLELGLHHEQQHQELLLTDALHLLSCSPLRPAYRRAPALAPASMVEPAGGAIDWLPFEGGAVDIGHDISHAGFAFDNELPRHRCWLASYSLAQRPVTQGEWRQFVDDGAYRDPRWWLSAGWDWLAAQGLQAPLYWLRDGAGWQVFGLHGPQPLARARPMVNISFFEAEAYARWHAAQHPDAPPSRLPTEAEWEHAAASCHSLHGNLLESDALQPLPAPPAPPAPLVAGLQQMFGDVWEWTRSAYEPYPGFRPWTGAVGEYNGKFMVDQLVLRGGSFATPKSHLRASYRNFFPATARWQFAGLRLARDAARGGR